MLLEQPRFDGQRMYDDMAGRGLSKLALAEAAGVSDMTVIRFLRGERQTPRVAVKLAQVLGYSVQRYLIRVRGAV